MHRHLSWDADHAQRSTPSGWASASERPAPTPSRSRSPTPSFDLVLGHAVLHHLPDLERAFAEFHRVLAPGGRIVFAGEPSRFGDRLAAIPKAGAQRLAPAWRALLRAGAATPPAAPGSSDGVDHELERCVDIHAFSPGDLARHARRAGFADVRVRGEELVANWFGWFNRALEASAGPDDVPMLWRQYAFHGYLLLQRLDERVFEPMLPPAIFYNLLVTARRALAPAKPRTALVDSDVMSDRLTRDFPLFPLGLVAVPGELIPLHIFEQRYKTMMNECLRDEKEFGIVWLSEDGLREIGCACEIDRVLERLDDGRMNLLARGTRPFRVVERQSQLAYPAGVVEFVEDRAEDIDGELLGAAHEAYAELVHRATDRDPDKRGARRDGRLRDGRDRRLRHGRQAGTARPALRERPAEARHALVPRRDQATGLRRPRAGAGPVQRQGPVRLTVPALRRCR